MQLLCRDVARRGVHVPSAWALMMNSQLMISSILRHADKNFPDSEIVSVTADNPRHRHTYKDFANRSRQLANALAGLGAKFGDRIGTLAWNDYRHLELYYGVSGSGMVCHTINPKLFPEQVNYIINHAEDKFIFVDLLVVPLLEALKEHLPKVEGYIILTDEAHMPDTTLPNVMCYETLLSKQSTSFNWPEFDENTASALGVRRVCFGHQRVHIGGCRHHLCKKRGLQQHWAINTSI